MAIDKKLDYVNQDGFKNYIKNSKSVTVPKEFKSRKDATPTKLAYITKDEAKMLKKMKKGTPHKGPKGIPSYDDYDAATGSFRSGAAMSAAETGGKTERDRADMRAAGIGPQEAQDLRSAAIAAGAGQRVNPGFFDSRNVVSPADMRAAKAFTKTNPFAKQAMRNTRGGGIMDFFTGGGFLGNLIRGLGRGLGFGKKFNEPTYDMSQFNNLGLLTNRVNPNYYNDLGNEGLLSLLENEEEDTDLKTGTFDATTFDDDVIKNFPTVKFGGTVLEDEFPSTPPPVRDDNIPLNLNFTLPIDQFVEVQQSDIDLMKTRGGKFLDYDTFKTISGNDSLTREEHAKLKATV